MRLQQAAIRFAEAGDIAGICELEKRVWGARAVAPLDQETTEAWLAINPHGFLVGEIDGRIRGYAYFETHSFDPEAIDSSWPPAHMPTACSHHEPGGSELYGISAAADLPGLGAALFAKALKIGKETGKSSMATLIRMQGLARFLAELRQASAEAREYPDTTLALWYAMRCTLAAGGSIGRGLSGEEIPPFFPESIRKDPVLTYPTHVAHMTLQGIVPSSFRDTESANLLALATFPTG